METAQKKCLGIFDEAEENVIAAGIIFMVLMETVNTIFKFAYPSAAGLPEELANFAYTWVAFLCASFCTKRGANIIVDALTNLYPKALRNVLEYVQYVLDIVMSVMIVYGGFQFVAKTLAEGGTGKTGFPLWIVYLAPIVGFGVNIIRDIQKIMEVKTSRAK